MSISVNAAVSAVKSMLDVNGWKYDYDESKLIFTLGFGLSESMLKQVKISIQICAGTSDPERAVVITSYGHISMRADEKSRLKIAEYLTRANYGLVVGNFEMDFNDGEIRYKVAQPCLDTMPGYEELEDMCGAPVAMFNHYGDGLMLIHLGVMEPEEAIRKAEA